MTPWQIRRLNVISKRKEAANKRIKKRVELRTQSQQVARQLSAHNLYRHDRHYSGKGGSPLIGDKPPLARPKKVVTVADESNNDLGAELEAALEDSSQETQVLPESKEDATASNPAAPSSIASCATTSDAMASDRPPAANPITPDSTACDATTSETAAASTPIAPNPAASSSTVSDASASNPLPMSTALPDPADASSSKTPTQSAVEPKAEVGEAPPQDEVKP